jgi:hypothetical protein
MVIPFLIEIFAIDLYGRKSDIADRSVLGFQPSNKYLILIIQGIAAAAGGHSKSRYSSAKSFERFVRRSDIGPLFHVDTAFERTQNLTRKLPR